ncbi:hypothetical protein [Methylobacterium isbiliense]|jgi:hypothetical protein|uniref:MFS transporter n=1 Tax=Methylobacterium isbiliense TaxID=315478 RepID=A0ABQ4SQ17_9HYPH|nr:hypothetical protein [Methylobacterium isbiliense]MDN3626588.1 hypothetical protein [Methylobacterium isbiliense]GJE03923.1 hypothetical protein GMJLKIPL_5880 [Methylobacterium isbiliense]
MTIALFLAGLAAVAVGPALAILTDRLGFAAPDAETAGMFVAVNDNAQALLQRAA